MAGSASAPISASADLRRRARARLLGLEQTDRIRRGTGPGTCRLAAVLVAIVARNGQDRGPDRAHDQMSVILTERAGHLSAHPGQVAFPGGCIESGDGGAIAAALREAEEEVGLAPERVEVLGGLLPYRTATGFEIRPVVGLIEGDVALAPDCNEVADIFEVPLDFVMTAANYRKKSIEWEGALRSYFVMSYAGRTIWGATAAILHDLYKRLS